MTLYEAMSITALILSIACLAFSVFFQYIKPKRMPKPRLEFDRIMRPILRRSANRGHKLVKEWEGWIIIRNRGTSVAHDVRTTIRVPPGENIHDIEPGYFVIDQQTNEYVELIARLFDPFLNAPPIHFFASVEPEVASSAYEDMRVVGIA